MSNAMKGLIIAGVLILLIKNPNLANEIVKAISQLLNNG